MIDIGYLLSEFLSDVHEWHYLWMGIFIGFIFGWLSHAWIERKGYGLRVKRKLKYWMAKKVSGWDGSR